MSLFGSLTASVSGLTAQGEAISVISDNLANVNTIGYKANRALFDQLVTTSGISGTLFNAGGVSSNVLRNQNVQGAMVSTQSTTDLGLSGNGFFMVRSSSTVNSLTETFYTRAGAFAEDSEGFLVTPAGFYLNGWRTESDGTIVDVQNPEAIELQSVGASARATTTLELGLNLTSSESLHNYDTSNAFTVEQASIVSDPTTADFVTDARFFDSQGGARDVSIAFVKRAANLWDYQVYTDGSNIDGGTSGTNTQIGSGEMRFNLDGTLRDVSGTSLTVDWSGGVEDGSITLDMGDYTGGLAVQNDAAVDFDQHILDIAIEDDANFIANAGGVGAGYQLAVNASGSLQLQDSGGVPIETITGISTTASTREVVFPTSGLRVTLSSNFDMTTINDPIGSFDVANVTGQGDAGGNDGVIQYSSAFNTQFSNQDGFGSGTLSSVSVDEDGFITGTFTNGETKKLWKVTVAVFSNSAGLEPVSNSMLRQTDASGVPLLKEAGVGGTGKVVSGALEQSTTDIAGEFSQMIVSQRAYQASSSVITTVDQMLNELLQLR